MLNSKDLSKLNLKQLRILKPHFDKPGAKNQVTLELIEKQIRKESKKPTKK